MNILLVRNDKLGDFTLALPAFVMIKASLPHATITAFVPPYTAPIAEQLTYIDAVFLDEGQTTRMLAKALKKYDVVISLFSTKRLAIAAWRARVPYRLAPATKWWQFFYNHRITQRRSRSLKPEYVYNLDMAKYFLEDQKRAQQEPTPPFLTTQTTTVAHRVILHPGSGGSANNLSFEQYAQLAELLYKKKPALTFVITAGPGEEAIAKEMQAQILAPCVVWASTEGLVAFVEKLGSGEIFIGGSTGPLHLAGALNMKTAGFYPNRRSATSLRWQTLNEPDNRLAFSPEDGSDEMTQVNLAQAAEKIYQSFLSG